MKKLIIPILLILSVNSYAQNITNTLGTGGTFSLKSGTTTFMFLGQADSVLNLNFKLNLPLTTSLSTGVIYKGNYRFLHDYRAPLAYGNNTFLGINAGNFTMVGSGQSSSYNTGIGNSSLASLTNGYDNTAVGSASLLSNTTGSFNSAFGDGSLESNTIGSFNQAFGSHSLYYNVMGYYNSAFGLNSLFYNTIGSRNCAFGSHSLFYNTSGSSNTAIGLQTMYNNTTASSNTAVGDSALYANTTGEQNTAVGSYSMTNNSTGYRNTALGLKSLFFNTTGSENTTAGYYSESGNTTGNENTAMGYKSLYYNNYGWQNTAVGDSALYLNNGNYNTALGYNAGSQVTTGYNLTCLGIDANPSLPTAGNEITLGNIYVTSLRCAVTTITSLSDRRDKKNIKDLPLGLNFIMKLKPRQFNWDKREWYGDNISDGTMMQEAPTAGFIAQELDSAQTDANAEWLNLVLKNNPEKWEATPGNLLPVVVKAVQELNEKNDKLEAENRELKNEIESLKEIKNKIAKLEEVQNELIKLLDKNRDYDVRTVLNKTDK